MVGLRDLIANDKLVLIPVTGSVDARTTPSTFGDTPTLARVATSTTSATLLSANTARKAFVIVNESAATLYVKAGTTAAANDYTWVVAAGATLTVDYAVSTRVDGILSAGSGTAATTEFT